MKLKFDIEHFGELSAGIRGYTDTVTIEVESGDPGGDEGDFSLFMLNALGECFDGATITPRPSTGEEDAG